MSKLWAGWSSFDITPRAGYPLAGYIARRGVAAGVLDPLFVRALVLRQDALTVGVLVADLLLVSSRWADRIRRRLARVLETRPEHIIVAATHTHSGPKVDTSLNHFFLGRLAPRERRLAAWIELRMEQTVKAAVATLAPVDVARARVYIQDVASDRNHPKREKAQPLFLMRFKSAAGAALFGVLGCHPTVLGAGNGLVSGDLHGAISRGLERRFGVVLVANGAGANISTRFTRREQTLAELHRLASLVIRRVASTRFRRVLRPQLSIRAQRLRLALRDLQHAKVAQREKSGRLAVVAREAEQNLDRLRCSPAFQRKSVTATLTALRIGETVFIALPLEVYSDTGDFFWRQARAVVVGYANGYWGYVPSPVAAEDDYEAISSPFDGRADALLRDAVTRRAAFGRRRGDSI